MERNKSIGFIYRDLEKISWVNNKYKIISNEKGKEFEMYNLLNDKKELNNISKENEVVFNGMLGQLFSWLKSVDHSMLGSDYQKNNGK